MDYELYCEVSVSTSMFLLIIPEIAFLEVIITVLNLVAEVVKNHHNLSDHLQVDFPRSQLDVSTDQSF